MKLKISDPIVVSRGPDSRTAGWGPYQFPSLSLLPDGRIVCTHSVGADSCTEYGKKVSGNCHVSKDGGKTWTPADEDEFRLTWGTLLPNGDRIREAEFSEVLPGGQHFRRPVHPHLEGCPGQGRLRPGRDPSCEAELEQPDRPGLPRLPGAAHQHGCFPGGPRRNPVDHPL